MAGRRAGFLREDRVVGKGGPKATEDLGLGALVHLGHEVRGRVLVRDAPSAGDLVLQQKAGDARGVDGDAALERCHAA